MSDESRDHPTANQRNRLGHFARGNRLAPGGPRPNSGRKTKEEVDAKRRAAELFERCLTSEAESLGAHFVRRAYKSDRVLIKAADILLPDEQSQQQPTAIIHQFIQFNANHSNTLQLPAERLPGTVLGSDDAGAKEAGGDDLAPAQRQGQDSIEFRSFANVPGKRR